MGDFLFGEEPSTEVQQSSRLNPAQEDLLNFLIPDIKNRLNTPANVPRTAELSLKGLENLASGFSDVSSTVTGDLTEAKSVLSNIFQSGPQDFNEFFDTNVKEPLLEDFEEDIIPMLQRSFVGSGNFYGGERLKSERIATEDLLGELTASRAQLALDYNSENTRNKLAALPIAGDFASIPLELATTEANILATALGGGIDLASLSADREANLINSLASLLGIPAQENIVINDPGSEGLIPGIAKAAAGGATKAATGGLF